MAKESQPAADAAVVETPTPTTNDPWVAVRAAQQVAIQIFKTATAAYLDAISGAEVSPLDDTNVGNVLRQQAVQAVNNYKALEGLEEHGQAMAEGRDIVTAPGLIPRPPVN